MTRKKPKWSRQKGQLRESKVRPMKVLRAIRDKHGSAFAAATAGEINQEEYLRLEKDQ